MTHARTKYTILTLLLVSNILALAGTYNSVVEDSSLLGFYNFLLCGQQLFLVLWCLHLQAKSRVAMHSNLDALYRYEQGCRNQFWLML